MTKAVEYVVRQDGLYDRTREGWSVWMINLDASTKPAKFLTKAFCGNHRTLASAEKQAVDLRRRDELHIDKVQNAA